jgi:poly-gamma-glutamate synthesis protein (capsule biosynthesis protein)
MPSSASHRGCVKALALTSLLLPLLAFAQWQPSLRTTPSIAKPQQDSGPPPEPTVKDGFTFAAGGDLLGPYRPRLTIEDKELSKVAKIFQSADAAFANLEGNLFDPWGFTGYPAAENGGFEQGGVGSGPILPKSVAADLRSLGIRMVSTANNHSMDWGVQGLLDSMANLDEVGIAHAGTGRNLFAARAAAFLDSSRGRVALIGAASTFMPMAPAGAGGGDTRSYKAPRPGISAIRSRPIALVTDAELETLKGIAKRQGNIVEASDTEVTLAPNEAVFIQQTFRRSDKPGLTYELEPGDREAVLQAIRGGKRGADAAVFSIHAHETLSGGQEFEAAASSLAPADFLQPLFHDAIDAGADIVVTHGPHVLRGIEIYKGKPIFYGLGSLFLELGRDWPREWFDSMVAATEFRSGRVAEVRIYPLILGTPEESRSRASQGVPHLATGADARRILEALQRSSAPYGTRIQIENSVGVIRLDGSKR